MDEERRFVLGALVVGSAALAHAVRIWPALTTLTMFLGGAVIALLAEAVGVRWGLLRHHARPQLFGVPVVVLLAWPATAYVFYRAAVLVAPSGLPAALLAATTATLFDVATDHVGVDRGHWEFPPSAVPGPRSRGVPWWNFVAWFCLILLTAMLPVLVGPP